MEEFVKCGGKWSFYMSCFELIVSQLKITSKGVIISYIYVCGCGCSDMRGFSVYLKFLYYHMNVDGLET